MSAAVVTATLAAAAASAAAVGTPATVVLHVDDLAHIAPIERATAESAATRIYAASGVRTIWTEGTVDPRAALDGMRHVAVVILGAARRDPSSIEDLDPSVLGKAARGAGRVYIHHPRVVFTAQRGARDVGTLLGMVIAHEVGHLLLPNNSHSAGGIMRADLSLASRLPQEFTPRQSATIAATLSGPRALLAER
jgi:hypothetical protein